MYILAIDTSCDETSVAITCGRRVIAEVRYSQVLMHKEWGGVVPSVAKRAHQERIDWVINEVCKKFSKVSGQKQGTNENYFTEIVLPLMDSIAVTQGPGLAIALEVGISKAKELAYKYKKSLIAVNHMEGHIYSTFVQNSKGKPSHDFKFPYLALLISGAHTEIVLFKDHLIYEILGQTRDDAVGEAFDKAARMVGFSYPGGPIIEKLAAEVSNKDFYNFPRPMYRSKNLDFSFSGLKTAFLYSTNKMIEKDMLENNKRLLSSFQEAAFDVLESKTKTAIEQMNINRVIIAGGVAANTYLRRRFKKMIAKYHGEVFFPPFKYLTGDNGAMIGVAAYYRAQKGLFITDFTSLERIPRMSL